MPKLTLLDTSVYLNILDIPGFNQHRGEVLADFENRIKLQESFLLPLATVWETGNHIAHLSNGAMRRAFGVKLVENVTKALKGETPYRPTYIPERDIFMGWLVEFPNWVQCNKSKEKPNEGISLGDFTLIKEWEQNKKLNAHREVSIWSLDIDLAAYSPSAKS